MSLDEVLAGLRAKGQTGFFPFLTAGFTSLDLTKRIITRLSDGLADGFEIGIPYSDPLADGPTIQYASEWALDQGVKADRVFAAVGQVSTVSKPIIFMTYFNVIHKIGLESFAAQAAQAGASGVIVPDLSIEESDAWCQAASARGLSTIFMVAPTSTDRRIEMIAKRSTGFIYCVSIKGVTGARTELPVELPTLIEKIRSYTDIPVVVGFGVSNGEQAKSLKGLADGVIVGSALINAIKSGADDDERINNAINLAQEIMTGLGRR